MPTPQTFKSGQGLAIALYCLAVPDVALGILGLAVAMAAGWPGGLVNATEHTMALGYMLFFAIGQSVLRLPAMAVMMRWTWRLTSNAEKQGRFAVSPGWAWGGYVVPVVAFWLPVRAVWALNARHEPMPGWQAVLVIAWWLTRLMTCTTGIVLIFVSIAMEAGLRTRGQMTASDGIATGFHWLGILIIFGLATRVLETAVVALTQRRQPKPGEVVAATVF